MRYVVPLSLATLCMVAACNPAVAPSASGGGSGGRGSAAGGQGGESARPGSGGAGMSWPDGGMNPSNQPPSVPGSENPACAASVVKGEQVPVDVLVLLDNSTSMLGMAGNQTKWSIAQQALGAFVKDPRSAGLGVGLQFFPRPPPTKACRMDTDCPAVPRASCVDVEFCSGGLIPPTIMPPCGPAGPGSACPYGPGAACKRHGICSVSNRICTTVNAPCPDGIAGDVCRPVDRLCAVYADSCDVADYERVAVGIAALPGNEGALVTSLDNRFTGGTTPTAPAVAGALAHLRKHQMANPTHRVALVLATDGLPTSCVPTAAPDIAAIIRAAQMESRPISTYVIGVFSPAEVGEARPVLEAFATAGGTGMPFVLTATPDLGQRLQEALGQIRGSVLPCEFTIPAPTSGMLDYNKVNVRFKGNTTPETTIPYVQRGDRCDPMRGGWYYNVDPAAGVPSRIMVCDATCKLLKSEPSATVSLALGCKTEIIE